MIQKNFLSEIKLKIEFNFSQLKKYPKLALHIQDTPEIVTYIQLLPVISKEVNLIDINGKFKYLIVNDIYLGFAIVDTLFEIIPDAFLYKDFRDLEFL